MTWMGFDAAMLARLLFDHAATSLRACAGYNWSPRRAALTDRWVVLSRLKAWAIKTVAHAARRGEEWSVVTEGQVDASGWLRSDEL